MYFKNCHSLSELKKEYRRLCKIHHPDKGGNDETMKAINNEYLWAEQELSKNPKAIDNTGYKSKYGFTSETVMCFANDRELNHKYTHKEADNLIDMMYKNGLKVFISKTYFKYSTK